jgi:RimJ/RimL family protein N-acetyltransferase
MIIRPIRSSDLSAFKALRLESLKAHPEAFGASHEDESALPDSSWIERIQNNLDKPSGVVFLAEETNQLAGMTGVWVNAGSKQNHSGGIWGVYVRPQFRGQKLSERLMQEALTWCKTRNLRLVRLTVAVGNTPAIRSYARCGFQVYGTNPQVIRVGDTYHDELMMWRPL